MRERRVHLAIYSAAAVLTTVVLVLAFTRPVSTGKAADAAAKGAGTSPASTKASGSATSRGSASAGASSSSSPASAGPSKTATSGVAASLLKPQRKYLGVSMDGVPASLSGLTSLAQEIGKSPNMVAYYEPWGTPLNQTWVLSLINAGALPVLQFEPETPSIATIAAGGTDAYARTLADTIRRLNVPVVVSFGHEMNGNWYPWGSTGTSPADFVKAWRHLHDLFVQEGATNAVWLWDANVTYPVPNIALKPLYPGDAYVDWVGLTGYFNTTPGGRSTFSTLFLPTMTQVRTFTQKPVLLAETGASPSPQRPQEIEELFTGVEARSDVLGFIWFDYAKTGKNETNWKFDSDPLSAATFARLAKGSAWGFPIG